MSKLLNRPLRAFTGFAAIILICSIPAYFFLIESIWLDELDDHNQSIKTQIQTGFSQLDTNELSESIVLWNRIHPESKILVTSKLLKDSVYTTKREVLEGEDMEIERFRVLLSSLVLKGSPYGIHIETNVEEVDETVLAISLITFVFIGLMILGFIVLNRQLSKRIWRPFTETLEKLKRFDLGNASRISFEETDIEEFAELNEALDRLIDNNIKVFKQQQEFTQNASHELQTPLALLKSKLDLLIQAPNLSEEQRTIIESLNSSVSRITRINKNLLLLAGIENKGYESTTINLTTMVNSVVEAFKEHAANEKDEINVLCEQEMSINANESLVEILLNNLISNAIRHGAKGKPIELRLYKNTISVGNSGYTVLNPDALFRRFISADSQTQGTGLGLAIVKEICDKYGWHVSYVHIDGRHIFSVGF